MTPKPKRRWRRDRRRIRHRARGERARSRVPLVRADLSRAAVVTASGLAQVLALIALLAVSTPLLGNYLAKVYDGGRAPGDRIFKPVERVIYRACRVDPESEQRWQTYAVSLLSFSFVSGLVLYAQIRLQGHL